MDEPIFTSQEIELVGDALFEAGVVDDLREKTIASLKFNETIAFSPKGAEAKAEVVKKELVIMAQDRVEYIRLDPIAVVCEEIVANMKVMFPAAYFSISLYTTDVTIVGSNTVPAQLTHLLRELGKKGFRQRRESINTLEGKGRSHYLGREDGEHIDINFHWAEETQDDECKLVQTGTKVINQPIYEMICPDDSRYEELTK